MASPRSFRWGTQTLPDPDPSMTPEQVRDYYSQFPGYEKLTTAAVEVGKEESGVQTLAFAEPKAQLPARAGKQTVTFVENQGKRG
jgi:PRTRC genetic system protein C